MKRRRSRRTASTIKQTPTRRSRRLSGLPPAPLDSEKKNDEMSNIYTARRRRSIKTPQKRTIISSYTKRKVINEKKQHFAPIKEIKNTAGLDGEIDNESDEEQIEGIPTESKPDLNIVNAVSIEENNVDRDPEEIKPPKYIYNQHDDESSENEQHDEEEKSSVLLDEETPKESEEINQADSVNKIESEIKVNNKYLHYQLLFIFFCIFFGIFLLHLLSWLKISNSTSFAFNWYNNYVEFILSFIFYTACRYYLDMDMENIYIKLNAINSLFVLTNIFDCFLSVLCKVPNDYELNFKSNEWISFGLFMSHFCDILYNLYYNNNTNEWLIFGRETMIIIFVLLFLFICDNAIDLVFVYCIKSLIMIIIVNMDVFHYTIIKDIQLNIISIHFGAWFSIIKIFKFVENKQLH